MNKKKKKKSKLTKADKFIIISSVVITSIIAIPILIGIIAVIIDVRHEDAAKKMRASQIAADPVTKSGLYNALNKERVSVGSSALASHPNLDIAAEQFCNDMMTSKYFDYASPSTGRRSSNFILENRGGLYYRTYVSSIMKTIEGQNTANEVIQDAIKNQATNLNNPNFNSIGWSICQSPMNQSERYIVATLAEIKDRPTVPSSTASTPATTNTTRTVSPNFTQPKLPEIPKTTTCTTNYSLMSIDIATTTCN